MTEALIEPFGSTMSKLLSKLFGAMPYLTSAHVPKQTAGGPQFGPSLHHGSTIDRLVGIRTSDWSEWLEVLQFL